MDKAARKKLNLKAIRRYDAAIVNILDQSPHAALYYFSNEKGEWVKKSVEGVLFLVQRNAPPYFAVYVMNRLAMENYTLYLTDFDDMELQENFIIYSTSDGERYAFWLYEEGDRQRLLSKITTLHDGIQKELSAKTTQKSRTGPDQISMPMPPTAPEQRRSSSTSLKKVETDLLAFLKNGLADQAPPPRHHHHPPNEYGPERTEQLQKHQQQALMNQSPAILPPFTDLSRMQWAPSPAPPAPPPVPPQPPQVDHGLEFSLPDTELMQSQPNQKEPPASHPLIDLFKNALTDNDNSQQQQYVIQSPDLQRQQQQQHLHQHQHQHQQQQQQQQPGMSDDPGYRLLELLKRSTVDDKMGQHVPSPPMPPSSSGFGASPRQAHYNQQPQQIMSHPPMPAHPSSSSSTPNTLQHQHQHQQQQQPPIFLGKELTKAYQPNMPSVMDPRRNNQHQASPRNSASLLQALQGGMGGGPGGNSVSPSPSSSAVPNGLNPLLQQQQQGFTSASSTGALHGSPGPAFSSSTSRSSFSSATPLMVHQSLDLTQTELNKRLGGKQHKVLSKPEFIQQYLNMVQNDPTFLDFLYEGYKNQNSGTASDQ